jgi:hypothetical protein
MLVTLPLMLMHKYAWSPTRSEGEKLGGDALELG